MDAEKVEERARDERAANQLGTWMGKGERITPPPLVITIMVPLSGALILHSFQSSCSLGNSKRQAAEQGSSRKVEIHSL